MTISKTIAFFNNKGGVSKTTTCFNVGWMLAERGHRVVLVDADPQCNLTGMVLDLRGEDALSAFYQENPQRNLREALEPAFASRPKPLTPVECVKVVGRENLLLIPGHVGLAEDEVSLGIAQQLSETVQTLRNLPGSFSHLFRITAAHYDADFVLVDLSPGLGSINQNLVATADFLIVPASPDIFSVMAIDSLSRVLPRWMRWARSASNLDALKAADYPFPQPQLKFLGTIIQRYRLRAGEPTQAFQRYFDELDRSIAETLIPALEQAELLLGDELYDAAKMAGPLRLASIPDFNTLIANSQEARKPVFALEQDDVRRGGIVWTKVKENIDSFRSFFDELAERIEVLTATR
jgi:cellulose biosynthesis protein BcsQ